MSNSSSTALSISIITVVRNNPQVVKALESVLNQNYAGSIESIVIDGASTDGTLAALAPLRARIAQMTSEPDLGIYDAMNKGLSLATGDIVGILNADDHYPDAEVLQRVAKAFEDPSVDLCYGDLIYVYPEDPTKILRYWKTGPPKPDAFKWGWMPPHPTFFVRGSVYRRFGFFDPSYTIAADVEMMIRLLVKHRLKSAYIPQILVIMKAGGASNGSPRGILRANIECRRAFRNLGLPCTPFFIPFKLARHICQIFKRPPHSTILGN